MRIRILTYNIHKCIGGIDRRYDPERIAEAIAHYDPDFALLQEVSRSAKRSNHDCQVDKLGEMCGFRYRTYFANVRKKNGGEYGNAILSHFPIMETSNIDLTIPLKKARSVLHARVRVRMETQRTRTLHLFNLHLGLSGIERKIQLRRFLDSHPFAGLDRRTPLLVAGDFNDVWGTLGKKLLEPAGFVGSPKLLRTFPAYAPVRALDSLYVRGALRMNGVQRSRLKVARLASDHLPLIADMEILDGRDVSQIQ